MDKFRLRYKEFNDVPEPVVAMAIDDAAMELCQKVWVSITSAVLPRWLLTLYG